MGMFDNIRCLMPLGIEGSEKVMCQTKDLGCRMDAYEIRADGRLWLLDDWFTDGAAVVANPDFDCIFFSGYFPDGYAKFEATFTNGFVSEIKRIR